MSDNLFSSRANRFRELLIVCGKNVCRVLQCFYFASFFYLKKRYVVGTCKIFALMVANGIYNLRLFQGQE